MKTQKPPRLHRLQPRWRGIALAGLLGLMGLNLWYVQSSLHLLDTRLGADILVKSAGLIDTQPEMLIMPSPPRRTMEQAIVTAIAQVPGIAATMPLYHLGKLSAQECPA